MTEKTSIFLDIIPELTETQTAEQLRDTFLHDESSPLTLRLDGEGLSLHADGQTLRGDFVKMLPRVKPGMPSHEMLVKTAKIKNPDGPLTAVDATAGLGEDSILLAAAGFHVTMFEKNPVIHALLSDALDRAKSVPELSEIVSRMELFHADSIEGMKNLPFCPDVILLDPHVPRTAEERAGEKEAPDDPKAGVPLYRRGGAASVRHGSGAKEAHHQASTQGALSGGDQARPLH